MIEDVAIPDNLPHPLLQEDWRMYCLDDCAILFLPTAQKLLKLNASAAFIWDSLARHPSPEACAAESCASLGVTPAQALDYIRQVVSDVAGAVARDEPAADHGALPAGPPAKVEPQAAGHFDLGHLVIRVDCARGEHCRLIADTLAHLHVAGGHPDHVVGVTGGQDHGVLVLDGRGSLPFHGQDNLLPALSDVLFALWYRAHADFIAIHAGLARLGDTRILLPGRSGSGKTTATAALLSLGAEYAADDVVALDRRTLAARGFPLPLAVKQENVARLSALLPALRGRREHRRGDGRHLRYLPPARLARRERSNGLSGRVDRIVFPAFRPGAKLSVNRVPPGETLEWLSRHWVRAGRLGPDDVARLVGWVAATPAVRLTFGTPEQAVEGLRGLLAAGASR